MQNANSGINNNKLLKLFLFFKKQVNVGKNFIIKTLLLKI